MSPAIAQATGVISLVKSDTPDVSEIVVGPDPNPINTTLTVELRIDNASNIWGWGVDTITWNSSVLQCKTVLEGSFLKNSGSTLFLPPGSIDNSNGVLLGGLNDAFSSRMVSDASSGVLAILKFNVTGYGTSSLSIVNPILHDIDGNSDSGTSPACNNATVFVTDVPTDSHIAHGPIANFSFVPENQTSFFVGAPITLDASSSQAGYDTENVSEACPITDYNWRIEYLNGTLFKTFNGTHVSFTVLTEGDLRIILNVTASDPHLPSNSDFISTSSINSTISIVSPPVSDVDVFTNRGGIGSMADGGAYGVQELVRMYALVTYAGVPVVNRDVAFSIQDAMGTTVALRVARTNETGVASVDYRLLNPGSAALVTTIWSITASVSVSELTVSDTMYFPFAYLGTIVNLQLPSSVHRSESLPIQFTICNFVNSTAWSEVEVTVFDNASVPIGSFSVDHAPQMQNSTVISATIPISTWAFTGQATVYICLLTQSSEHVMVPMAPETVQIFQILP
jgi:hypothetical protein